MKWFPSQSLWGASVWVLYGINTLTDSIHCIDWLCHLDGLLDLMFPVPNATDLLYWWSARWNCSWLWSSRNLKLSVTYCEEKCPRKTHIRSNAHAYRLFAALQIVIDWKGGCVINSSSGEADCGHFFYLRLGWREKRMSSAACCLSVFVSEDFCCCWHLCLLFFLLVEGISSLVSFTFRIILHVFHA